MRPPIAIGLLCAALVAACTQTDGIGRSSPLLGSSWILTDVRIAGTLRPAVDDSGSLTFPDAGRMAGTTGCNRFTGTWTAGTGDALTLRPGATTLMACPGPLAAQETAVIAALSATATYRIEDAALTLLDAGGVPQARFRAAATGLAGTAWRATGVNNGAGGVVTTAKTGEQTLRFAPDGSVRGFAGCGGFTGAYTADGPGLSLTVVADEECAEAAQQQYLAALGRATAWQVDGNRLELRDDAGALQAGFTAAD